MYGFDALSKRFNSSTSAHSTTGQPSIFHQLEEMCESIQKLKAKLMEKDAKIQILEKKVEQVMKNQQELNEQIKLVLKHIKLNNLMPVPLDPTIIGHHTGDHIIKNTKNSAEEN